jgi:hypothetical protein
MSSLQKRLVMRVLAVLSPCLALAGVALLLTIGLVGSSRNDLGSASASRPARSSQASNRDATGRLLSTADTSLPADCTPKPSGPPGAPYQLGLVGTVQNGVLKAGPATIADITAKFCGIVTVVAGKAPCGATGSVVSPLDGQIFGSLSAQLTMIPGMDPKVPFVAHPGTITGGFSCVSSQNGLAVNLDAKVSGSTGLFGLSCTIGPISIPLTGVVTGPLTDPAIPATITLRSSDFAVPTVQSSPACGGAVPINLDQIAGLPIAPGGASAVLPATTWIYQPAGQ